LNIFSAPDALAPELAELPLAPLSPPAQAGKAKAATTDAAIRVFMFIEILL
jgi:hypothetical protein